MQQLYINSLNIRTKVLYAFGYSAFVIILILLIQPIGLIKIEWFKKKVLLVIVLGVNYGLFYFIQTISLKYFLNNRLSKKYQPIFTDILFILLVSLLNILIIYTFFPNIYILYTVNIYFASFVITALSFITYNELVKLFSTSQMQIINEENTKKEVLNIKDSSTVISIPVNDIFYIKSFGNYIQIFEKNNKKGHLLRFALKDLDNKYTDLYRCHKSYLVNVKHIKKITGNTKGYKLELNDLENVYIPVSRTKGEKIAGMIS